MSDTQQLAIPAPTEDPKPDGRRWAVIVGLSLASVMALLLLAVIGGGDTFGTPDPGGSGVVMNDPLRPQKHTALDAGSRSDTEAAVRNNWPLMQNDEFDGVTLDTAHWNTYSGRTTDGVGQHDPKNLSVSGGIFTITSHDKQSGGMSWAGGQRYGRWEVRARTQVGNGYSAVILLWPDAEDFPVGGEIDFMEIPLGDRKESNFVLHYGKDNSQNGTSVAGDFTQWHNYAVEWTSEHVAGFIDGQEIFRTREKNQVPPRPMHLAIQQDPGPFGDGWVPAPDATTPAQVQLQVDWVRIYGL